VRWLPLPTLLLALHVLGNMVWIGALLSVVTVAGRAMWVAEPSEVGAFARRVHSQLAVPGFLVSFLAGAGRLALTPALLHLPWMHAKLALAAIVIVVHHVIGGRVRRLADGGRRRLPGAITLGSIVFVCAAGAVLLGVAKSLP
jgi:protoporphyrinogen IX oxidase